MPERKQYLETGRIVGTHGIKGEMKAEVWSDSPETLKNIAHLYFDEGRTEIKIESRRIHKKVLLMMVDGIDSPEKADLLRGRIIYLNRDDIKLAKGKFFIQDILGLTVKDGKTGEIYGKLTDVIPTGANDVYEITDGEKKYLFPAVAEMIKHTDIDGGFMEVLPIPGIFDEEGETDEN